MSDWNRRNSPEGAALSGVRAVIDWFAGLDAMAVVFGTCLLTCVIAFIALQLRPARPVSREAGASIFSHSRSMEAPRPPIAPGAPSSSSSLEFAPQLPPEPEPPQEPSSQPDPEPPSVPAPAAQPVLPQLPAPPAPRPNPGAALSAARNAVQGGAANNSFAAGAAIGAKPNEEKAAEKIGGEQAGTVPSEEEEPGKEKDLVRQLIPLIKAFQANGIMQKYNSGGQQRNYAVEQFGKTVAERNLLISTGTIVQPRDARALAEGLGIHVPKGR